MSNQISNNDDVIDSRDVIARIEELQGERADLESEASDDTNVMRDEAVAALKEWDEENGEELAVLLALQEEGESTADWVHGETLIRDDYFQSYAQELAEDCGMVNKASTWPNNCIDWEEAARQLKQDYFTVDFDGVDYLIRA